MLRSLPRLLACFCALAGPCMAQDNAKTLAISRDNRTMAITATDRVVNGADLATVHVGYALYARDQQAAYASASAVSNRIAAALQTAGVPRQAIESEAQSLAASQPYVLQQMPQEQRAEHAYSAQQSWTVRVPAAEAARVLDVAVKAGANESGQIDWSLADPDAAQSAAATKAIQRARAQATAMAVGLGVHLGALLYASNQVDVPIPHPLPAGGPRIMAQKAEVQPLALNSRQIETSATVYAVFALE